MHVEPVRAVETPERSVQEGSLAMCASVMWLRHMHALWRWQLQLAFTCRLMRSGSHEAGAMTQGKQPLQQDMPTGHMLPQLSVAHTIPFVWNYTISRPSLKLAVLFAPIKRTIWKR